MFCGGKRMSRIADEIQRAKNNKIIVPDELNDHDVIRGVYGIFSEKEDESTCLYIGRTYSIADRLFASGGHISMFNSGQYENLVPKMVYENIKKGYHIIIKVLKVVEFKGDNYYRDMQRLAYAEMELIEKYQQAGQCLWQLPEGTWISEEKWNKRYKKEPCPE